MEYNQDMEDVQFTDNIFTGALGGEKSPEAVVEMSRELGLDVRLVDAEWPEVINGEK